MIVKLISATNDPEKHIEYCGRISYNSLKRISNDSHKSFLSKTLKNGHLSIFEHASATFYIEGISRAASHQLVRHRIASYTQKSQRYVGEKEFGYVIPDEIKNNPKAFDRYKNTMDDLSETYRYLMELGIKKEDARFVLPNASKTTLTMSANFREWLTIIDLRVSLRAQWEIRRLAVRMWKELYKIAPTTFSLTYFEHWSKDIDVKKKFFEEQIFIEGD